MIDERILTAFPKKTGQWFLPQTREKQLALNCLCAGAKEQI